jgi:hypothetical protein
MNFFFILSPNGLRDEPPLVGGGNCILMQFTVPADRAKRSHDRGKLTRRRFMTKKIKLRIKLFKSNPKESSKEKAVG